MARRALAGTRQGAMPCRVCRHARLRHRDQGRGACTFYRIDPARHGAPEQRPVLVRCDCLAFTTDERLF